MAGDRAGGHLAEIVFRVLPALLAAVHGAALAQTLPDFRGALARNEEIVRIETRPGVGVRMLVDQPRGPAKGVFILFPGGDGTLLYPDGTLGGRFGGFRLPLAEAGYAVATVDVPSDHPRGLGGKGEKVEVFRISPEHTADGRAIVNALHARWPVPVTLIGHSMGAISVAHLAASLEDPRIAGAVLLSSPGERGPRGHWFSTPHAALSKVRVPVLVVHHRDDGCPGARFLTAKFYPGKFTSSPRTGFLEVTGGRSESSDPCSGNNFHSFFGVRSQVMQGVLRWLGGADVERVGE